MTGDPSLSRTRARPSGTAVWRQIADTLSLEIRDRAFAATGRLPGETELATRFGVNRHTLRLAVGALQAEGLLRIEKGRGMFVQHKVINYSLSRHTRFTENLMREGLLPGKQLLTARSVAAPELAAQQLGLDRDTPVLMLETLHEADGQPVTLATAYYPAGRFDGLLEMLDEGLPTSDILCRLGIDDYLRAASRVSARMPTEETARLLKQPVTRPLLCVEGVDVDLQGVPIKYGETLFCGDRVQLVVAMGDTR